MLSGKQNRTVAVITLQIGIGFEFIQQHADRSGIVCLDRQEQRSPAVLILKIRIRLLLPECIYHISGFVQIGTERGGNVHGAEYADPPQ